MNIARVLPLLTLGLTFLNGVSARAAPMLVDGHEVEVLRDENGDDYLLIDGVNVRLDGLILLDAAPFQVGIKTVLTGVTGSGGNACGAAPMVIEFNGATEPFIYVPEVDCQEFEMAVSEDQITYTSLATLTAPGVTWIWRPVVGFELGPDIPFAVDPSLTWDNLEELVNRHPSNALQIAGVMETLQDGIGANWPVFAERISGIGSGEMIGGGYLGEFCIKFTCDEDFGAIYLDQATQKVSVFWHVEGEKLDHIWPDNSDDMPDVMREYLASRGL